MSSPLAPSIIALGIVLLLTVSVRVLVNALRKRKAPVPPRKPTALIALSPEAEAARVAAVHRARDEERASAIDSARASETLIDGVFVIARHARYIPKQDELTLLSDAFPDQPQDTLANISARCHALLSASAAAGDELLSARFANHPAVLERLTVEHPGFASSTYSTAINYGCQQSR